MSISITNVAPQLRTTDLASSIRFYTEKLGMSIEFQYENFYAGIRAGAQVFHLKHVDCVDPSIGHVDQGDHLHLYFETPDIEAVASSLREHGVPLARDVHDTPWQTRELVIKDDQGHTLYFGQPVKK
jgi:catechol 2,3-dioxygenase-like lactoylglutathione lyase family enzyme